MQPKFKSFRELVESKKKDDDYEPLPLWIIPFYSQTRQQYYNEVADSIKQQLDNLWKNVSGIFTTREEFDESDIAEAIWIRHKPYWDGLNDAAGWIDIRLCVRHNQIQLSLYLPSKQVLRILREKKFVFQYTEIVDLSNTTTNEDLQNSVVEKIRTIIESKAIKKFFVEQHFIGFMGTLYFSADDELQNNAVEKMLAIQDKREKKLFFDLEPWYCVIRHTDLAGIVQNFTRDYQEKISKNKIAG